MATVTETDPRPIDLTERPRRSGEAAPSSDATTTVVDAIDVASVARVALLLSTLVVAALLAALAMVWLAAVNVGLVPAVESFMVDLGFEGFAFDGLQLLRAALLGGLALVLLGTGVASLMVVLYNAIGPLVGGVQITTRSLSTRSAAASRGRTGVV